jgi:Spy/CpxP family protein refolding chaperone
MKTSLRILVAAAALAIATPMYAQGGGGGGGGGGRGGDPAARAAAMKEAMFAGITLTAEQTKKIDEIQAETAKKRQEMMAGGMDMRSEDGRAKIMELTTNERKAIRDVLTAEQQPKYDENLKNMPQGRGRGGM